MQESEVEQFWAQFKALYRSLRRALPAVEDLSPTELQVLISAERAPRAPTPGQMAAELQLTSSNMAAALRALSAHGMISRNPDPTDRRKILVQATAKGRKLVAQIRKARRSWLHDAIEEVLNERERQRLLSAGELMQRVADNISSRR